MKKQFLVEFKDQVFTAESVENLEEIFKRCGALDKIKSITELKTDGSEK